MMRNLLTFFVGVAYAITFGGVASAQSHEDKQVGAGEYRVDNNISAKKRMQLSWNEITELVGNKVRITIPDSETIEGKVNAVNSESFIVDIHQTAKNSAYPKGEFTIKRSKLTSFELNKPSKRWRIIGTSLGLVTGFLAGVLVADALDEPDNLGRPILGFFATAITIPIVGYHAGRHADMKNWVVVEIK